MKPVFPSSVLVEQRLDKLEAELKQLDAPEHTERLRQKSCDACGSMETSMVVGYPYEMTGKETHTILIVK
ncbi:hypothetical protein LP420_23100 [Massilia sp. B-10]|nr:hypothetical protein LP420_23100 [Massilia sp. B-10]UUZ52341.1 hypothetical protein LP419_22550 [Massilia sp. H-1]